MQLLTHGFSFCLTFAIADVETPLLGLGSLLASNLSLHIDKNLGHHLSNSLGEIIQLEQRGLQLYISACPAKLGFNLSNLGILRDNTSLMPEAKLGPSNLQLDKEMQKQGGVDKSLPHRSLAQHRIHQNKPAIGQQQQALPKATPKQKKAWGKYREASEDSFDKVGDKELLQEQLRREELGCKDLWPAYPWALCPDSFEENSFTEKTFANTSLGKESFTDSSLTKSSFTDSSLAENSFSEKTFLKNSFFENSLDKKSFAKKSFDKNSLVKKSFAQKSFANKTFDKSSFDKSSFGKSSLKERNLDQSSFANSSLDSSFGKSSLEDSSLGENSLHPSSLANSSLKENNLKENSFEESNFEKSSFNQSSFEERSFDQSSLEESSLKGSLQKQPQESSFEQSSLEPNSFDNSFGPSSFRSHSFQNRNFPEDSFQTSSFQNRSFQPDSFQRASFQDRSLTEDSFQLYQLERTAFSTELSKPERPTSRTELDKPEAFAWKSAASSLEPSFLRKLPLGGPKQKTAWAQGGVLRGTLPLPQLHCDMLGPSLAQAELCLCFTKGKLAPKLSMFSLCVSRPKTRKPTIVPPNVICTLETTMVTASSQHLFWNTPPTSRDTIFAPSFTPSYPRVLGLSHQTCVYEVYILGGLGEKESDCEQFGITL